jgi:hypothetical protein
VSEREFRHPVRGVERELKVIKAVHHS